MHMYTKTKIQVPISTSVLKKSRIRAEKLGFGSINDVVRIMLTKFGEGRISLNVIDHDYVLTCFKYFSHSCGFQISK